MDSYSLTTPAFSVYVATRPTLHLGHLKTVKYVEVGIVGGPEFVEQAGAAAYRELRASGLDTVWLERPRANKIVKQYSHGCSLIGQELLR